MVEFADDVVDGRSNKIRWDSSSRPSRVAAIKRYGAHIGLFLALVIYTALGALVFRFLERDNEIQTLQQQKENLTQARIECIDEIVAMTAGNLEENIRKTLVFSAILRYEDRIAETLNKNITKLIASNDSDHDYHWDYIHSAFFASTVLTTIGYGNSAPTTDMGRLFCILFALIGIPLTLSVIADLGKLMASLISMCFKRLKKHIPRNESTKCSRLGKKFGKSATVGGAICFLLLYIAAGATLYMYIEDWKFFESFYFCFITMTTIGFGDLVPGNKQWLLICTLYILIGLAITSTAIELVRSQYADSWRRMRELSTRLQGFSGHLNLDVNVLQDLKDLKKALALSGRMREGSIWKKFWENEDGYEDRDPNSSEPRLIQIIIYESSV